MSPRDVPAPRPSQQRDPFDKDEETDVAARGRAVGLHDAEQRRRRQLAAELVAELRRPLIESHGPSDLATIAALHPGSRPAR